MANRYQNDYNDQDYPHYYDRDDRYDSQSERSKDSDRFRTEQRNRSGSGRENTQGGSYDYNQSNENFGSSAVDSNRDKAIRKQGFGGNDYGRGYDSSNRANDDFASTNRSGNYDRDSRRERRDERGDYTLYGYDRDQRYADRSGDYGNQGERTSDYSNNYNYSGGSYARSDDDKRPSDGRGGSSRYRGEQGSNRGDYGREQSSGQGFYGQGGGYTGSSEKGYEYNRREGNRSENRFRPRSEEEERGWWERTTDEVASWFGDDEAARRRENDSQEFGQHQNRGQYGQQTSLHRGRGPKNYRRTDERIKEDINDRLTDYAYLDASDIDVEVSSGEVTLTGTVESRYAKRMAEDIAENVSSVTNVENRLRVKNQNQSNEYSVQNQAGFSSTSAADSSGTYGSPEDLAANYSNQGLSEASPIGKSATGDLTGSSSSVSETNNSNTGTMAASATGGTSTDETATSDDKFDSSATFSERGVDKLSGSSK
ncbi:MAG: BON domain-containing protein [Pyrinomonadaceae bacterium]